MAETIGEGLCSHPALHHDMYTHTHHLTHSGTFGVVCRATLLTHTSPQPVAVKKARSECHYDRSPTICSSTMIVYPSHGAANDIVILHCIQI